MSISESIARIQEQITAAARRAGRSEKDISLVAVSKTFPVDAIHEAYAAGIRLFGENKVQEFSIKAPKVTALHDAEWHMIGHLQTNKAAKATELFSCVDSVDSLRLAEKLNIAASQLQKKLPILIEINVGGEKAKSGVGLDSHELEQILQAAARLEYLEFRGLMTVPPFTENPEDARYYFRQLRELRDRIASRHIASINIDTLSMGMSHDFEVAIEEGSNCVRIGTAIFGERNYVS
jgi:pyridoxal phosphate enzyme (YggS family)